MAPKGRAVRPTADRVRESVFGILGSRVKGAGVLDLFAGTGALGLEALSRGALSAVLVEQDPAAFSVLRRNVETLRAERAEVLMMDYRRALRHLKSRGRRFRLVFLDPPYGKGLASRAAEEMESCGVALPGATVVVEESAREAVPPMPPGWEIADDRRYGDTRVIFFEIFPDKETT